MLRRAEHVVRSAWAIGAQVDPNAARAAGESRETEASRKFRGHLAGTDEAVPNAGVLVVDAPQLEHCLADAVDGRAERRRTVIPKVERHTARDDGVEEVALPDGGVHRPQQLLLQPAELCETEREAGVVAECAEVAEVIFQQVTYGGMPVVVEGLQVLRDVLVERGEWSE